MLEHRRKLRASEWEREFLSCNRIPMPVVEFALWEFRENLGICPTRLRASDRFEDLATSEAGAMDVSGLFLPLEFALAQIAKRREHDHTRGHLEERLGQIKTVGDYLRFGADFLAIYGILPTPHAMSK